MKCAGISRQRGGFAPSRARGAGRSLEALPLDALYGDLEQLEQRLTAIEEKMIARLRSDADDQALFEARRTLDQELNPIVEK